MRNIERVFKKYKPIFEIILLEELHYMSSAIKDSVGLIFTNKLKDSLIEDMDYGLPSFGVCYGNHLVASVDNVEKYKKYKREKELLELTLYKNLPIVESSDVFHLLQDKSNKRKTEEVMLIAFPEKCGVEIDKEKLYYKVYFDYDKTNTEKLLVNFMEIKNENVN